ncbi:MULTISPECIES: hypothetical protein [Mycolicibacterium]|uniref:hypothetical protein n=1 Tax=Mycolicibacterium TaxID=1866885 RepID=UPI000CFA1140|nr:hypothetical protein [Mycolicibacterium austroafricanum]PQP41783.1 hypothetical protein C6A88_27635 [Mycolicibacterium austroafricanum]
MKTTTDLLLVRWRAAQLLLAISDGDLAQVKALNQARRIEGISNVDTRDELDLLRDQFARRPRYRLVDEINRVWLKLRARP